MRLLVLVARKLRPVLDVPGLNWACHTSPFACFYNLEGIWFAICNTIEGETDIDIIYIATFLQLQNCRFNNYCREQLHCM